MFAFGRKDSENLNVFKIERIYNLHSDIVEEIHEKIDENSQYYSDSIKSLIMGSNYICTQN